VHRDKGASFRRLGNDLRGLVNNHNYSDVTFIVEGGEEERKKNFHGHKNILSLRSERLRELMSNRETVEVSGISPLVFECFLEFLYTGNIEKLTFKDPEGSMKDLVYLMELLRVAELYSCDPLTEFCEDTLAENLTVSNALTFLRMAEKRRKKAGEKEWGPSASKAAKRCYRKSRKLCGEFLLEHINEVVEMKAFLKLKREALVDILSDLAVVQVFTV
jgi:hypothetical protein